MPDTTVILILAAPALLAIFAGSFLLRRAWLLPARLPEEFALAVAWVFVVGSLFWLGVFLSGSTFLGFGAPWTWLTAAHFAFAGFGALTVTALSCRVVSSQRALSILRILVVVHPIIYLVTAAGITGIPYCDEVGAAVYEVLFVTQLAAVVCGRPTRMARGPRMLLMVALAVPVVTLIPALAWAFGRPLFDIAGMVRYHGTVNAVGHVGLGLVAFAWGRPRPQLTKT
ncbi:YndJ family transporter [Cerasicoccus fimbriatus]|uniref:YndJ family transporter n=1 Tax=Cerasicoccus fimbriatus TaxID=3014554 RepID=UPI0022B508CD|nr:YndJ family transporter [Cerasicoccus sp. TK19100]